MLGFRSKDQDTSSDSIRIPDVKKTELESAFSKQDLESIAQIVFDYSGLPLNLSQVRSAITADSGVGSNQVWRFLTKVLNKKENYLKKQLNAQPKIVDVIGTRHLKNQISDALRMRDVEELALICETQHISSRENAAAALMGGKGGNADIIINTLAHIIEISPTNFRAQLSKRNKIKNPK